MISRLTHVTVLVEETDEAIDWYTERLGFALHHDEEFAPGMRWVTVGPEEGTELVLQEPNEEAFGEEQAAAMRSRIGEGTMTVFETDDCRETVSELADRGVEIASEPEEVPWGVSAIFVDLYGNPYNLVEPHELS